MLPSSRSLVAAAPAAAVAVALTVAAIDLTAGAVVAMVVGAALAFRRSMWISVCALAWALVFICVLYIPGPYDSWAGRAIIPVLALYAGLFLLGWALARYAFDHGPFTVGGRTLMIGGRTLMIGGRSPMVGGDRPAGEKRALAWPPERRLRLFLLALLAVAIVAAVLRFWGSVPPLFAPNPDIARELLRYHTNIYLGLMWEAWTLGLAISLFRLLAGGARGRWPYLAFVLVFTFGSALGASKNSVLVGVVAGLVATLSVRLGRGMFTSRRARRTLVAVVLIGCAAVGLAAFLGGQRTLAGTGTFEDEFRGRFGDSALATSAASLDLSLTASAETLGRLWSQRENYPPGYGRYSLIFSGSPGQELVGAKSDQDLYAITSGLSQPYFMNTATFVAIPLLDFGPIGAGVFLFALGLLVGFGDRRLEVSSSPAAQLGRAFIIYFAAFGIYELYPLLQPTWLATVPGLYALHLISRRRP